MKAAIFDFDGTLLDGNSYHEFLKLLLRRPKSNRGSLLALIILRRLRLVSSRTLKNRALSFFDGKERRDVSTFAQKLYLERLRKNLRPGALREIELRRAEGCTLVLITRAFDFVAETFARDYNFDLWRATPTAYDGDGRCLGRIDGAELYGSEKAAVVQKIAHDLGLDLGNSWSYGDERSDFALLSLVGNPVFVLSNKPVPRDLPSNFTQVSWKA